MKIYNKIYYKVYSPLWKPYLLLHIYYFHGSFQNYKQFWANYSKKFNPLKLQLIGEKYIFFLFFRFLVQIWPRHVLCEIQSKTQTVIHKATHTSIQQHGLSVNVVLGSWDLDSAQSKGQINNKMTEADDIESPGHKMTGVPEGPVQMLLGIQKKHNEVCLHSA